MDQTIIMFRYILKTTNDKINATPLLLSLNLEEVNYIFSDDCKNNLYLKLNHTYTEFPFNKENMFMWSC